MHRPRRVFRWIVLTAVGGGLVLLAGAVIGRGSLATLLISRTLVRAGAEHAAFTVTQVSPWSLTVEDLGFRLADQPLAAERVHLTRQHWWMPSLGRVQIENATVPLNISRDETIAAHPAPAGPASSATGIASAATALAEIPAEEVSVEGRLVLQAEALSDRPLEVNFTLQPTGKAWQGRLHAAGEGFMAEANAHFDTITERLTFEVAAFSLELASWQEQLRPWLPLPEGDWTLAGRVSGRAAGHFADSALTGTATLQLHHGQVTEPGRKLRLDGIEAGVDVAGFAPFSIQTGTVQVDGLRWGIASAGQAQADFALEDAGILAVNHLSLEALGGHITLDPFRHDLTGDAVAVVMTLENIAVEEVMKLTPDLPAYATGRVAGRVPLRYDDDGLRFGRGWLELAADSPAEIQFHAEGLLTRGRSKNAPGYSVLQQIESGLLRLRLNAMRLDLQPENAPPGRSAQFHLAGEPVDPNIKAPVILDLNVNGPLEKLISLGLDSRVGPGAAP